MSNLARLENNSAIAAGQWNQEQIDLIKQQIAPGITDPELMLFGQVCHRTGLDPFLKQIYAVPRKVKDKQSNQWIEKMSIQVSIDGFRLTADRTGKYGGSETFWCGEDGVWRDVWLSPDPPAAAKTEVWKIGCVKPFVGVARFSSYKQEYNGALSGQWKSMPDLMIGKCSEALALRKAFPAELSGIYSREEMGQAEMDGIDEAPTISQAQAKRFHAVKSQYGWTDEQAKSLLAEYTITSSKSIPTALYNEIINRLEQGAPVLVAEVA